jgi:hypothetical protein
MPSSSAAPRRSANQKTAGQKDTVSKSGTNSATATVSVPVITASAPPLLVRLLQFGLVIEPRVTELAAGTGVERSSGKSTLHAESRPSELAANNSTSTEDVDPKTESSSANLAFALRLTNSAAPMSAAPDENVTAAPETPPSSDAHVEPAVARAPAASATNSVQASAPVQPAQQSSNQPSPQDPNKNPKQDRDEAAVTATKAEPAAPASTLPAAAASASTVIAPPASTPAAAISQAPVKEATPVAHTAPATEVVDKPAAAPAQRISLSVSDSDNQRVEVHLMERAGEVRVSVRTADEGLTHSMRADLGSLSGKLTQSGYSTESFAPTGANTSSFSNQRQPSEGRESSGGNRQNPQQNQSGGQQQSLSDRREGRDERGRRPAWVEELENSLSSNAAIRSNKSWQQA